MNSNCNVCDVEKQCGYEYKPCDCCNYRKFKQKPEQCDQCKGLGYYDEGHENDDGTMSGGNYVQCQKCKTNPSKGKHEVPHLRSMD